MNSLTLDPVWRGLQRHVDLALVGHEATTTDHRPNGAGRRVERHDRCVDTGRVVGQFVAGLLGQRLQVRVERGVDAQTTAEQLVVALLVGVAEDVGPVEQVVA